MDRISGLSDELLVKILSFLPTKDAVSTSILSKQWKFLWMWLPKLEYSEYHANPPDASAFRYRDFIDKNLPLHRAPFIESLVLKSSNPQLFRPEDINSWVGIAVSRSLRELSLRIRYKSIGNKPFVPLPSSLYTCNSLTTLKLKGESIFVDVPQSVSLPCLKTLKLRDVTYLNDDSLRLLLSNCPVLEDLLIDRYGDADDNVRAVVVKVSALQRLTLKMYSDYRDVEHVIVTPLKYFKIHDDGHGLSYMIEHMPKLEEADLSVTHSLDKLLGSMTSVKHLSVRQFFNVEEDESVFDVGTVFNQLEHLKLCIYSEDWSKILVWLLRNSPKLRVLNLYVDSGAEFQYYAPVEWKNRSSVPECLQNTLETFKFEGFVGTQEEGDFLSFFFKNACCLKSTSITDRFTETGI
ncbi:F-box domain-containing protein [Hirschfeldia incana]|nr:F-box domain-containing protein [Hirschfeldia incana]